MTANLSEMVEALEPKLAQAGGPLMAAHDAEFVRQTQSLWNVGSATRRTWVYPDPDTAPYVSTATLGTYTKFLVGNSSVNAELALPWLYQSGVDGLLIRVYLCTTTVGERISIQATLTGLEAAITADKNSPAVSCAYLPVGRPPGLWLRRTDDWRAYVGTLRFTGITTDNMTADRRGSIKISLSPDPVTTPDNLNIVHNAKIYYVTCQDVFPTPTPEDAA